MIGNFRQEPRTKGVLFSNKENRERARRCSKVLRLVGLADSLKRIKHNIGSERVRSKDWSQLGYLGDYTVSRKASAIGNTMSGNARPRY